MRAAESVQEEEGAGVGAAVADIDQRRPAARHGAQGLCRSGGMHAHSQAGRVLPVLQRHRPVDALRQAQQVAFGVSFTTRAGLAHENSVHWDAIIVA